MASKKMTAADKPSKHCMLPLSRVKMIMKTSPGIGDISPEAVFTAGKGAEHFIQFMARHALKVSNDKTRIDYNDIAKVVREIDFLNFLSEMCPYAIKGKDYLKIYEEAERRDKAAEEEEYL